MLLKLKVKSSQALVPKEKEILSPTAIGYAPGISEEFKKTWEKYCRNRSGWKFPLEYARLVAFDFFTKGMSYESKRN